MIVMTLHFKIIFFKSFPHFCHHNVQEVGTKPFLSVILQMMYVFSALNQAILSINETHNIFLFRIKPTFLSRREYIARIIAVDIALNVLGRYPLFEVKGFRGFKQLIRSSWVFTVFFSKCILTRATQFEYKHSYIFQMHDLLPQTTPLPESSVSSTNVVKFLKSLLKHNIQL